MFTVNKKLWSFNFGCIICASFIWLISFGNTAPVLPVFASDPYFVHYYYPGMVTAFATVLSTLILVLLMNKGFNICTSEHTFWLVLPTGFFLALTALSAFEFLMTTLYAVIPALLILITIARIKRARFKAIRVKAHE